VTITGANDGTAVIQNLILDGSYVATGDAVEASYVTLGSGNSVSWGSSLDGSSVVSSTSRTLSSGDIDLVYAVSTDGKTLVATKGAGGDTVFEITLTESGGEISYAVDLKAALDPLIVEATSDSSGAVFSASSEPTKTVSLTNTVTLTASAFSGVTSSNLDADGSNLTAQNLNGNAAGLGVKGGNNQTGIDTDEALQLRVSTSINTLTLAIKAADSGNKAQAVAGEWFAYKDGELVAQGNFSDGQLVIDPGQTFDTVMLTAGSGGSFQVGNTGGEYQLEIPATIELSAQVDGAERNFTVTFDGLASGDNQLEARDEVDLLIGSGDADVFAWSLSDGSSDTETGDTIRGFDTAEDAIDLGDLLSGYNASEDNLTDFISVAYDSDSGNTVIQVSSNGDGQVDQTITVEGVDLTDVNGDGAADDLTTLLNQLRTGSIIDPDSGG